MRTTALTALGLLLATTPAHAGFEVISPTTASQEVEMELQNTVRVGGVVLGETLSEHEIGVNYGALQTWEVGIAFGIDNVRGQTPSVDPPAVALRDDGLRWQAIYSTTGARSSAVGDGAAQEGRSSVRWYVLR